MLKIQDRIEIRSLFQNFKYNYLLIVLKKFFLGDFWVSDIYPDFFTVNMGLY